MADDGSAERASTWPLAKFQFSVRIGGSDFIFQEITGISSATQVIEYRGNKNPVSATAKMPGVQRYSNITCKKGHFFGDKDLWTKYNAIRMNTSKRELIVISLLDESNSPVLTWNLQNAFPVKMTVSDITSDGRDVAVESMELAHEGLVLSS